MKIWIHAEPMFSGYYSYCMHFEEPQWNDGWYSHGTTLWLGEKDLEAFGITTPPNYEKEELFELEIPTIRHTTTWLPRS
jgi:hypothetical protein